MTFLSYGSPHFLEEFSGVIGHEPILFGSGDVYGKVLEEGGTKGGVGYVGVKLESVNFGGCVFDGDKVCVGCGCCYWGEERGADLN